MPCCVAMGVTSLHPGGWLGLVAPLFQIANTGDVGPVIGMGMRWFKEVTSPPGGCGDVVRDHSTSRPSSR